MHRHTQNTWIQEANLWGLYQKGLTLLSNGDVGALLFQGDGKPIRDRGRGQSIIRLRAMIDGLAKLSAGGMTLNPSATTLHIHALMHAFVDCLADDKWSGGRWEAERLGAHSYQDGESADAIRDTIAHFIGAELAITIAEHERATKGLLLGLLDWVAAEYRAGRITNKPIGFVIFTQSPDDSEQEADENPDDLGAFGDFIEGLDLDG